MRSDEGRNRLIIQPQLIVQSNKSYPLARSLNGKEIRGVSECFLKLMETFFAFLYRELRVELNGAGSDGIEWMG